jgi:hypothetical protein
MRLPRIVTDCDAFWHWQHYALGQGKTRVWVDTENKAIIGIPAGTKVTIGFGPASAIIKLDCVIRDQK